MYKYSCCFLVGPIYGKGLLNMWYIFQDYSECEVETLSIRGMKTLSKTSVRNRKSCRS